ncbi:ubiquitin-like protein 5 [Castor canadensis]|uniref:Ubiquitin-like protein 5 n=1 Tax=Castor canadensis TaxID=51338 RepID=A0AC58K059_CASCN
MTEVVCKDCLGEKVKFQTNDTTGDLEKLITAKTSTHKNKIVLKKSQIVLKDHMSLGDCEIHDGMILRFYYQ